jgi:hypothetical protein
MQPEEENCFDQLAWLAYAAQQMGWDGLADRIAGDVAASHTRLDDLKRKIDEVSAKRAESYQQNDNQEAA